MSKSAQAGELSTKIQVMSPVPDTDADGYAIKAWKNVFGDGAVVWCKWVNAHGKEVYEAAALSLIEPATLTLRYSDKITPKCQIYREGDAEPFAIISVDNVENRGAWLEIKVKRAVEA